MTPERIEEIKEQLGDVDDSRLTTGHWVIGECIHEIERLQEQLRQANKRAAEKVRKYNRKWWTPPVPSMDNLADEIEEGEA